MPAGGTKAQLKLRLLTRVKIPHNAALLNFTSGNMNNVNPDEINHFSNLGSRFWDENGEFWTLHKVNPLRMSVIEKHVDLTGKTGIDVGCGGGILTEALVKAGAKTTGIDLAEGALEVAKLHRLESKLDVDYQCITAEEIATNHPEQFDFVACMEMLEHVPDPESVIKACSAMLKPGGKVFFSTLNRNAKSFLTAIVAAEYFLKMIPKGTHHYETFIKPEELVGWARNAGLTAIDSAGIDYHPLKKTFSLSDKLDVNYILVFEKN